MTSLRHALREATHAAHEQLEAVLELDVVHLTRARYGRAIQVLHAVRAGWEPALAELLPGAQGPHVGWLDADLQVLGMCPLPPAATLPIGSEAEAWGISYVLEGSALGGRSLLKALSPFGITPERGARYFAGRGKETGPHWTDFLSRLEAQATQGSVGPTIRAAQSAFKALYQEARKNPPLS